MARRETQRVHRATYRPMTEADLKPGARLRHRRTGRRAVILYVIDHHSTTEDGEAVWLWDGQLEVTWRYTETDSESGRTPARISWSRRRMVEMFNILVTDTLHKTGARRAE